MTKTRRGWVHAKTDQKMIRSADFKKKLRKCASQLRASHRRESRQIAFGSFLQGCAVAVYVSHTRRNGGVLYAGCNAICFLCHNCRGCWRHFIRERRARFILTGSIVHIYVNVGAVFVTVWQTAVVVFALCRAVARHVRRFLRVWRGVCRRLWKCGVCRRLWKCGVCRRLWKCGVWPGGELGLADVCRRSWEGRDVRHLQSTCLCVSRKLCAGNLFHPYIHTNTHLYICVYIFWLNSAKYTCCKPEGAYIYIYIYIYI